MRKKRSVIAMLLCAVMVASIMTGELASFYRLQIVIIAAKYIITAV